MSEIQLELNTSIRNFEGFISFFEKKKKPIFLNDIFFLPEKLNSIQSIEEKPQEIEDPEEKMLQERVDESKRQEEEQRKEIREERDKIEKQKIENGLKLNLLRTEQIVHKGFYFSNYPNYKKIIISFCGQ